MKGKIICQYLKGVRRKIAEANGIELDIPECTFQGECCGTCPRCESEIKYLEDKLKERGALAKKIAVIGVAAGMAVTTAPNAAAQVDSDTIHRCKTDSVELEPIQQMLGIVFSENEEKSDETPLYFVEKMPEFPGGVPALNRYLREHFQYPASALEAGEQGIVLIEFIVEKDGSISDAKVIISPSPALDEEALRIVRSFPKWKPGEIDGRKIRVFYDLPIRFEIPDFIVSDPLALSCVMGETVTIGRVEPFDTETKVVAKPFHGTLSTLPEDDTNRELASMPPEFPGGEDSLQQYIKDHVVYPDEAKNQKIEGTVILQVHISETGKVTNVKVKTKVHPQLDAEAVRLVRSLPDWIPATLEGSAIKTKRLLYVTFSLK